MASLSEAGFRAMDVESREAAKQHAACCTAGLVSGALPLAWRCVGVERVRLRADLRILARLSRALAETRAVQLAA